MAGVLCWNSSSSPTIQLLISSCLIDATPYRKQNHHHHPPPKKQTHTNKQNDAHRTQMYIRNVLYYKKKLKQTKQKVCQNQNKDLSSRHYDVVCQYDDVVSRL